jgi:hypothetical protein
LTDLRDLAVGNLRDRHEAKIRELCADIAANAGYILADLDRSRVPRLRNLLDDAIQIATRIEALEAVAEMRKIYPAEPQPPAGVPYPTHPFAGSSSARQSVGLPGHCERCAEIGHVRAHPSLGCGDVGCERAHGPDEPSDRTPSLSTGSR